MKKAPSSTIMTRRMNRKLCLEQMERQHLLRRVEHLQLEVAVLRLELPFCSARISETWKETSDVSVSNYVRPVGSQEYRSLVASAVDNIHMSEVK